MSDYSAFEYGESLLASTTLESTYAAARAGQAAISKKSHVTLLVTYTAGASETANSLELKIEFSDDGGTTWWHRTNQATSTGTTTITEQEMTFVQTAAGGTADYLAIELKDLCAKDMRVSAKESGVASNKGTVAIDIMKGGR